MTTYVYRNGKLIEKSKAAPLSGVFVISDTMRPMINHADGRVYDSKSKMSRATRDAGCIEIGNETLKPREPVKLDRGQRRDDIRRAFYEARNGR